MRVRVELDPDVRSECVLVRLSGATREMTSDPIDRPLDRLTPLVVAVYQGDLADDVTAQATGYGGRCLTAIEPPEYSELVAAQFEAFPPKESVVLRLSIHSNQDSGVDGGQTDGRGEVGDDRIDGGDAGAGGGGIGDGGIGDGGIADSGMEGSRMSCGSGQCAPGDFCNSLAECVPSFPYVPSNFTEQQLDEVPSTIRVEIVSPTTINTQTEDGGMEAKLEDGGVLDLPFKVIAQGGTSPPAVIVHARSIHVADAGLLTVEGARPLIIAVREDANINGTIITRAGADLDCAPPKSADDDFDGESQGGGGGGGFGESGGGGANSATQASVGQGASGAETLVPLRGGCRGGTGGPDGSADGGLGGGAVQLSAVRDVFVNGTVAAPGRGGRGAPTILGGGGGGGGSGGGLLLEGRKIVIGSMARLTANGGGGGQGASTHEGSCGHSGDDGLTDGESSASGGIKGMGYSSCAGEGGQGGSGLGAAGQGALPGDCTPYVGGGGGGGGAVGRIRLNASTECAREDGGVVSPPATGSGSGC